jgi:hypothetical protein
VAFHIVTSSTVITAEGSMHTIQQHRQSRVTAVFEDRAHSFILGTDATLEELADRLASLGGRHNAWPLAITVKFAAASRKRGAHPKRQRRVGKTFGGAM